MIPRTIAISVALAAVAAVPVLWAADTSAASKPPTPTTEAVGLSANATPKLITFDFPGGTVAELLAGTGFSSNATVNIFNGDGIGNIWANVDTTAVMPPFSVHNVTPENLVHAFNEAMAPSGLRLFATGSSFLLMPAKVPDQSSEPATKAFDDLQKSLAEARIQLESLRQKYLEKHPTVVAQQWKIAAIEKQLTALPLSDSAKSSLPIALDFPGGSCAQLVDAVAKASTGTFNIIGQPDDMKVPCLPPFSVRNADPGSLMEALNTSLQPRSLILERPYRDGYPVEGTYTLRRMEPNPVPRSANSRNSNDRSSNFQSFQLSPYLGALSVDDIVDAIRAAWTLDPTHEANSIQIKYHPATKMLFVSGPPESTMIVTRVIGLLIPTKSAQQMEIEEMQRRRSLRNEKQESDSPPSPPDKK
jgi:hypothetical protein